MIRILPNFTANKVVTPDKNSIINDEKKDEPIEVEIA